MRQKRRHLEQNCPIERLYGTNQAENQAKMSHRLNQFPHNLIKLHSKDILHFRSFKEPLHMTGDLRIHLIFFLIKETLHRMKDICFLP